MLVGLLIILAWYTFDLDGKFNMGLDGVGNHNRDTVVQNILEQQVEETIPLNMLYDSIVSDSYNVVQNKVGRNQFLPIIFKPYDVDFKHIDAIGRKYKDVFDVRKMRVGNPYKIFLKKDSSNKVAYFVYEIDNTDYVVYDFNDSLRVWRGKKPIEIKTNQTAGIINSSLYLTLDEQDANPYLAIKLSEVFAWVVDFYRIQKGDHFKIIYDEEFVDGKSVGIGQIHAAVFNHYKKDFYAIHFKQDSLHSDYFDENNNSCRRAFLKAPLKYSRISSRYSGRRFHPVQKIYKAHLGTDYAAPRGTPIYATGNGTVIAAAYTSGNGNYVKIRHNSVYTTQYLHMSGFAKGIRKGVHVNQGAVIGYVGSTGLATGPHLCYRFWKNGKQVDALKVDIPPSEPVKAEHLERYEKLKKQRIEELNAIHLPTDSKIIAKKN